MNNKIILNHLSEIETRENVKIFYACESGSRAWGFPSKNSDYDIRFFYIHPVEWYLSVSKKRDVLEYPLNDKLDISGWDIQKALLLLQKSNPPLIEWLGSPIVYLEKYSIAEKMRTLLRSHYSPASIRYHYLHMAQNNFREYLRGDNVWLKKYFYVLRPILTAKWIEQDYGLVPTEFEKLVERLVTEPVIKTAIDSLVEAKKEGKELDYGPRIDPISEFIEQELDRLENCDMKFINKSAPVSQLNNLFLEALGKVWNFYGTNL